MKHKPYFVAIAALALAVSTVGGLSPALARPATPESKSTLEENKESLRLSFIQIVSLDAATRTVKVLTPRVIERQSESGVVLAIDVGSTQGGAMTLPLASKVVLRRMDAGLKGTHSTPTDLTGIATALNSNQRIAVAVGKNDKGKVEVQQLLVFTDQKQKTVEQMLKEHFSIAPSSPRKE